MLKQLKLQAELKQRNAEIKELLEKDATFKTRSAELAEALEQAQSDEDFDLVNTGIEALDTEVTEAGIEEKKVNISTEIERIENELSDLAGRVEGTKPEKRGEQIVGNVNRMQARELLKTGEYHKRSEVIEFYDQLKQIRSITGAELTIPNIVINRIMDIVGDYTTMYPLVDKIRVSGTARILIDTDTDAATWIEQKGGLPTGDVGSIANVDFDGFKVGKVVLVDNAILQDSIINVDEYVTKKIARAIAKALDLAIVKGTGAVNKQPDGIIPKLKDTHKVEVEADGVLLKNLAKKIALIDTGDDNVGTIIAAMNRKTYYNRLLEYSINVDSAGNVVGKLPNLSSPDLLGLRIVFNNNLDEDTILLGDFEQYTLVERENITIDNSTQVKFIEDQTAFRGKGRFDGKPVRPDAFVLVTIVEPAVA